VSYYDFDDHFWSPQTVCSQSASPKSNKSNTKNAHSGILIGVLSLACIAVWTPLLLQMLVPTTQETQEGSSLDTDNIGGDCLLLRRERFLFCGLQQQR